MWFNHKSVIFGNLKKAGKKKSIARTARIAIDAVEADAAMALIRECRFVGYRGEIFG